MIVSFIAMMPTTTGPLIDRGDNGELAGGDICIMSTMSGRSVDIQGIDNHQLTDIPIVTAEGVVTTQQEEAILFMNQCAHISNIHSSVQLHAHGVIVDDEAIENAPMLNMSFLCLFALAWSAWTCILPLMQNNSFCLASCSH